MPDRAELEDQQEDEIAWLRSRFARQEEEIGELRSLMREQVALTTRIARALGADGD